MKLISSRPKFLPTTSHPRRNAILLEKLFRPIVALRKTLRKKVETTGVEGFAQAHLHELFGRVQRQVERFGQFARPCVVIEQDRGDADRQSRQNGVDPIPDRRIELGRVEIVIARAREIVELRAPSCRLSTC